MVSQAGRLRNVRYDIRGPVLRHARALEAQGHRILKLNLGNPAPFGLDAPDAVLGDVIRNIGDAQGYSDARGIHPGDARHRAAWPGRERGIDVERAILKAEFRVWGLEMKRRRQALMFERKNGFD